MGLETAKRSRKPRAIRSSIASVCCKRRPRFSPPAAHRPAWKRWRVAEVGIGTLYRHFPTREALFEAVYRREVDQLGDLADRLTEKPILSRHCARGYMPRSASSRPSRA